ncbi:FAD-binding protein [Pikeienuella piscinae]|uniref:FAD-binding protein n=1 Tax=Pikeienuella piscinae TaxID=2748098 RepID=A0A7L5BXN6_9RHOB|nr:FAD-binding protein [Pikeienuella piscinae]QIE54654.1 FAD-binding protein [Pikeienuella piscinae]
MPRRIQNWKRAITYTANSLERVTSVAEIQAIVKDTGRYPSPVRAKGSHHSTTRCVVAEGGTVIDMTGMNAILKIDRQNRTITMQAGVLLVDAAKALEKEGLQFYVNIELGNLTVGAGACSGTKDASYFDGEEGGWEYGQVHSYCVGLKAVGRDGEIVEATEKDVPELMTAMRASMGMLGLIFEVTYRVKPIKAMAVRHAVYPVHEFARDLEGLIANEQSIMLYLFPFLDKVVVEIRYDMPGPPEPGSWVWKIRNYTWKTLWPGTAHLLGLILPRIIRFAVIDVLNRLTVLIIGSVLKDRNSSPADQIIRYSETAGFASYTFSIWAFPRESYAETILKYFAFCKQYYKDNHYRCDMLNVGYHIAEDRSSLFSYTRRGPALTLDPVATGLPGWEGFLYAYNDFCSRNDGRPLFNQTGSLSPLQARKAFGPEIDAFLVHRRRMDPDDRFYTPHFRALFESV